jgi:histidine triad (HIT) family protein
MLQQLLFRLARSRLGGVLVGWVFAHLSGVLPVRRCYETRRIIAFDHPCPSYPVHVLIVPKTAIRRFEDLGQADLPVVADVVATAQRLVGELRLGECGYRLIVNGGRYQDVKQLHFHLVSEDDQPEPMA